MGITDVQNRVIHCEMFNVKLALRPRQGALSRSRREYLNGAPP